MIFQFNYCCTTIQPKQQFGDRTFAAAGPQVWNSLPPNLRPCGLSYGQFRRLLKTWLFEQWGHGPLQDHKSGTVCRPISDHVGCHTASSGGHWRHGYSNSEATAQCELFLTGQIEIFLLTYLLTVIKLRADRTKAPCSCTCSQSMLQSER